jgi:GT2 family glycosyltransferase
MKPHFDCCWRREEACDVDVGLICRDDAEWLGSLIRMLPAAADGLRMRLLLLDDASSAGTAGCDELWEPTTVLRNPQPLGFGQNLNRLLAASTASLLVVLDPCIQLPAGERVVARLVRFMESQPRCGACTCRVYRPDGSYLHPARRFPTLRGLAMQCLAPGWPCSRLLAQQCYLGLPRDATYECDWVLGTCMVLRRRAALAVGGFDAQLCPGLAEADFGLRLATAGWQVKFHGATWCQMRALAGQTADVRPWVQAASALRYLARRFRTRLRRRFLLPGTEVQEASGGVTAGARR